MTNSPVSLKEIAVVAGCSPRVAAAVLNPGNSNIRVGEATQQRILATASEMGYRANGLAQAMATGKSRVLGVMIENRPLEHEALMLSGVVEAATAGGYLVKILSFQSSPREVLGLCVDWRLAGLLSLGLRTKHNAVLIEGARGFDIPLAILDDVPMNLDGIGVSSDEMQGVRQIVEHLVELGHRDIGFLGADTQSQVSQRRADCFPVILQELGLEPRQSWILNSDWSDLKIIGAAVAALLAPPRPTAIVCAGDPLAIRVVAGAHALGLHVPRDLSVTGFANFSLSKMLDPPLTTIEQSFSEMGRVGVEQTIAFLESKSAAMLPTPGNLKIPTRLIVRASTAPPPQPLP